MSNSHEMEQSCDGLETPIQAANLTLPVYLHLLSLGLFFISQCGIAAADGDQSIADNKGSPDLHGDLLG